MKLIRITMSFVLAISTFVIFSNPQVSNAVVGWVGAAGSPYIGSAATQPMDINLSNNTGSSSRPSIAINSLNYPCISWMDSTSGNMDIYFARWNGSDWVNASGTIFNLANGNVSNNSGGSSNPMLKLDSSDNPCISWTDNTPGNTEIYFARWDGSAWVTASGAILDSTNGNVSNDANTSQSPSLALDSLGNPHIAWCNWISTNYDIIYTKWNGSNWVNASGVSLTITNGNASNDSENNYMPSLDLDTAGNPWIAWYITPVGNYEVMLGRWNGSAWVNVSGAPLNVANGNISNNSGISFEPSLVMDTNNRPCIAWYDNSPGNFDIYFARWNGTNWVTANGSILGALNANVSNSSGDANLPRLALDSSNQPHITWYDDTMSPGTNDIYYVRWNGSNWVNCDGIIATTANSNVSNTSTRSYFAAIALDSLDYPHIVWDQFSPAVSDIYYIKWAATFDGSFSMIKSVDTNSDGDFTDSGKTVNAGDTLTYKINWQFAQGQDPLENPYLYDTVPDGTTYVAGSASPNANISYSLDGGATWIAGEPPNGSPAGTQLRWDLSAIWFNVAGSALTSTNGNVSNNGGSSQMPSLALDSSGNPSIAWSDNSSGNVEIYFAKWNGTGWVNASGIVLTTTNGNVTNNAGMSVSPSLALDSTKNPCIVWTDTSSGNEDVHFARWNGAAWVNVSGSALTVPNSNVSNNVGGSYYPYLAIDSSGYPCIAWTDNGSGNWEIYFSRWNGVNWINASGVTLNATNGNMSNNSGFSQYSPLKLDSSGNPCIAWYDNTPGNSEIYYAKWNGTNWINASGLVLNTTNGNMSNNAGSSLFPSMALDTSGYPCISWQDDSVGGVMDIFFARWNGSAWVNVIGSALTSVNGNVSNNPSVSSYPSLNINSSNNPCIAWSDNAFGNSDIYYTKWSGLAWTNANGSVLSTASSNLIVNAGTSNQPSLFLDSTGKPNIAWFDNTPGNNEIMFAKTKKNLDFIFSVKVDNPPTSPAFCNKATFRHKWNNGMVIESNEVCNTINYNFTGTFTLGKGVDTNGDGIFADSGKTVDPGTKLSYKIDWSFDNPNNDPLFGAYVYDTIPLGTTYVAGSAPTYNLSYSTNGGSTWIAGEPPNGSPAGTRLRWKLSQPGWTNAKGQLINSTNPNVSNNTGISDFPSLAINKNGDPCIAWSDDVSGATLVYYARWNGSQWVNAAGLPFTVANGSTAGIRGGDPSLALDPVTGNPWIAFQSNAILFSNLEIHILRWNGTQWTNAAGITATLLNTNVSNNTGLSWFPSHQLALDSNGYPCFVWKDNTTGSWQSYFARWNGVSWTNVLGAVLTATNGSIGNGIVDPSFWPTLVLDENDYPCIAWDSTIAGNSEVCFARWNGTQWVNSFGTPLTPTNCNISNNSGSSVIPYLAMDKLTHNPCIVWSDDTSGNYEIYFAKWNGSAWVNASGSSLNATNANMSFTPGLSSLLSIAIDGNNLPAVTWEDDTTGNSEIYFAKWNGSSWVNAKGDAFTTSNGIINTSPARSWFPSLAFDPVTNNPNIAWLDKTPGSNEVYFARWTDFKQSFIFSVKIDKPFTNQALSPVCNTASFAHVFDRGNPVVSNSACVSVKGIETNKEAVLTISKTSKSFQYWPKDFFEFTITVKNTGKAKATNVVVSDLFPKELIFVSSTPSGLAGSSTVKFQFGDFNPGRVEVLKLKFKLNPKLDIQDCIMVTNEAVATSGVITVKDLAVFKVCAPKAPCPLYFDIKWTGLNTNIGKTNQEISAKVMPSCGSSPYKVVIDWGDGSKSTGVVEKVSEDYLSKHSYTNPGQFLIKVTVSDAYMSTKTVEKTVKIE